MIFRPVINAYTTFGFKCYADAMTPHNECILAFIDSEYGEVFFNEKDTLALEAWNRRHNDD